MTPRTATTGTALSFCRTAGCRTTAFIWPSRRTTGWRTGRPGPRRCGCASPRHWRNSAGTTPMTSGSGPLCSMSLTASGAPSSATPTERASRSWGISPSMWRRTPPTPGPAGNSLRWTARAILAVSRAARRTTLPWTASSGATLSMTGPTTKRPATPGGFAGCATRWISTTFCALTISAALIHTGPFPPGNPPPATANGRKAPAWTFSVNCAPRWASCPLWRRTWAKCLTRSGSCSGKAASPA